MGKNPSGYNSDPGWDYPKRMSWDILQRHGARRYSGSVVRVLSQAFFTAPEVQCVFMCSQKEDASLLSAHTASISLGKKRNSRNRRGVISDPVCCYCQLASRSGSLGKLSRTVRSQSAAAHCRLLRVCCPPGTIAVIRGGAGLGEPLLTRETQQADPSRS